MTNIWDSYVESNARRFGVPPALVQSVIGAESGGRANAVSRAGAGGYMQLMPNTYKELAAKHGFGEDRFDPANNIGAGTSYMRQLYDKFGNWPDAIAAYNAGPGRVDRVKAGTSTMPAETTAYVPKVMAAVPELNVAKLPTPQPAQETTTMATTPNRGLLDMPEERNWLDGLGGLFGQGQTESQPPGPTLAQPPLNVNSRMDELMQGLLAPQTRGPSMTPGQYQLAGAGSAVGQLAGVHDRKVGFGEILGALGGGLTRGRLAGEQAQRDDRASQFQELGNIGKIQEYQRAEATAASQSEAARQWAREARASGDPQKIAMAAAVERDPRLLAKVVEAQAGSIWPKEGGGFTLNNKRYTADGRVIVDGGPDTVQLTPDQVAQAGLPAGTVAQRDSSGKISVIPKPTDPTFDNETKLRTEFTTQAKPLADSRQMYGRLEAAYKDTSGLGDVALVYSFMKMLDPTSVVRETEYATAANAGGIPEHVRQIWNRLKDGERLPPSVRDNMYKQGQAQYGAIEQQHSELENRYRDLAVQNKLDPRNVVIDFRGGVKVTPGGQTEKAEQQGGGDAPPQQTTQGPQQPPSAGQGPVRERTQAATLPPEASRVTGQTYMTPSGPAIWRGAGWELVPSPAGSVTGAPGRGVVVPVR